MEFDVQKDESATSGQEPWATSGHVSTGALVESVVRTTTVAGAAAVQVMTAQVQHKRSEEFGSYWPPKRPCLDLDKNQPTRCDDALAQEGYAPWDETDSDGEQDPAGVALMGVGGFGATDPACPDGAFSEETVHFDFGSGSHCAADTQMEDSLCSVVQAMPGAPTEDVGCEEAQGMSGSFDRDPNEWNPPDDLMPTLVTASPIVSFGHQGGLEAVGSSYGSPQAVGSGVPVRTLEVVRELTQEELDAQEADDINTGAPTRSSRVGERGRQKRAREEREAAVRVRHIPSMEEAVTPAQKRMALLRAKFQGQQ